MVRVRRVFTLPSETMLRLREDSCFDAVGTAGQLQ